MNEQLYFCTQKTEEKVKVARKNIAALQKPASLINSFYSRSTWLRKTFFRNAKFFWLLYLQKKSIRFC